MKQKDLTLLFLITDEDILLAMKKRGFGVGRWNGVGGKVEPGETLEAALVRECQEEIAVTPIDYEHVAELTFNELHETARTLMHVHVFTCSKWSGRPTETEEMRPQWFKKTQIPYDKCWSDDSYWLPSVLEGKKLVASFVMDDQDQVVEHSVKEFDTLD